MQRRIRNPALAQTRPAESATALRNPFEMSAAATPARAYVALGANLGDPTRTLIHACRQIDALPTTRIAAHSSLYRSAPVDASGPDFLNAVVALDTGLAPLALLAQLQRIEDSSGRERPYRHAPRTLDLDLLLHGDQRLATDTLALPHPRMQQRAFVLLPLAEIAPQLIQPCLLQAVAAQRIERLPGDWWVAKATAAKPR